jgi:TPR repeat protein
VAAGPREDANAARERGDYATALRLWRSLADQGNARAQYNLGSMYALGRGVPQNHAEAVKWTRLAADQDDAEAQFSLDEMYTFGYGVPQDHVLAHMWFNLSAAQGNQLAAGRRDRMATRMTPAQIAKARKLAREWCSAP